MRILHVIVAAALIGAATLAGPVQAQGDAMSKPGAHVLLSLDGAEVRAAWLGALRDEVRSRLREAKIGVGRLILADGMVQVRLANPADADAAVKALADIAPATPGAWGERLLALLRGAGSHVAIAKADGGIITITPTPAGMQHRTSAALDDAVAISGRRLEGMGVAATAVREGRDRIHVHAPALKETATLKDLLTSSARLAFHEVHATVSPEQARRTRVPLGFKIYSAEGGELLLREVPVMKGSDLADAQAVFDQRSNEPVIAFRFNSSATRAFAKFTTEHIGQPFAIVLDDAVLSAPVIREPIQGGSGQVSGNFTIEEARRLAVLLRAGSLPAGLAVVEERAVPGR